MIKPTNYLVYRTTDFYNNFSNAHKTENIRTACI